MNDWTTIIKPKTSLFHVDFKELWQYRDLYRMFVKRDIVTWYKQTILGPLWFFIQPILTTLMFVIEDAAQGMMASYKGKALGTLSDFGCYSFHETKNYSMGEGGALLINKKEFVKRAEIIREKGTNRCEFHRGEVDKYTWVDLGSSYLPSELNAAYLYAQLIESKKILDYRLNCFQFYNEHLEILECRGLIQRPHIPAECEHNAHMFYIKVDSIETRTALLSHLTKNGILAVFHYVPLHVSPVGKIHGRFHGEDQYTTSESNRLLRLPLYYGLQEKDQEFVVQKLNDFF
jgi:dTDP-4-amino-4,6-dideoxygalactose transaminase